MFEEELVMHQRSSDIKFTFYNDANEVVDELLESLRSRYQRNLETSMRGNDFVFDSVQMMYCKCHEVNFTRGGSYADSKKTKQKNKKSNKKSKY